MQVQEPARPHAAGATPLVSAEARSARNPSPALSRRQLRSRARGLLPALPLLLAVPACDPAPAAAALESAAERAPLVRVVAVEERAVRQEIEATAYLESRHRVSVLCKVQGRVLEVVVDEGETVSKGQPLARLDDRELLTTRRQIAVQLEDRRVRAELGKLEVEAAIGREAQARIDRDRARSEHERLTSMDPQSVSRKQLEDVKFTLDAAEQALAVAGYNRKKAALDREAAQNSIAELEARRDEVELQLDEHVIKAPLDGVVVERRIKGGETISSQSELFVVADLERLLTYLSRPQVQLPLAQKAKEVRFTTDAWPGREFVADVDLVSPVVDQATGHFKIRARTRASDAGALRPGMFIRARILTEEMRQALMVPKAALLAEGERTVVFVVRDGQAHRVRIEPGLEEQAWVESKRPGDDGVRPGDLVVVSGHGDLKDQAKVEVVKS